jgi:hypothetical protein
VPTLADANDSDKTEVIQDPAAPKPGVAEPDYTEYQAAPASVSTGFDQARTLAQKAQAESGRLLKKRFVLEDVLGSGGMGVVYKTRDLRKVEAQDSNPYIATKILGGNFKDHPKAFMTLQQEAVKSQKLAHPNIVTVHDFDRDGNTIFMTMELLKGDPLDSLLRLEAPFSKETCLRYFSELCSGLEYAHKRGLIHSDLKPENIFVTAGGTVKILDFGIARAASLEQQGSNFDAGKLGALTPAYATLEMLKGEPPSFSDDIYALACVLYIMLTGKHPYARLSAAEAQAKNLKPARPAVLNNIEWQALSQALSFSRAKRPASVAEFRAAFMPEKRSNLPKALAALALLAIVGGAALSVRQYFAGEEQQAAIDSKLAAAKECFFQRSYQCAIDNARIVVSLAPDNADAQNILQGAGLAQQHEERENEINSLLQEASTCLDNADFGCARVKAQEVLDIDAQQLQARQMLEQITRESRRQELGTFLTAANKCLDMGDTACANTALRDASTAGAEAADLYEVRQRVDAVLGKQADEQRAREQSIATLLAQAKSCLSAGNVACTQSKTDEVLALDSANTAAIELQQSIKLAAEQRQATAATLDNFLREAESCFDKKNYSCAIAKSESALAIMPGSSSAAAMKDRALEAQNRAKKQIVIQ